MIFVFVITSLLSLICKQPLSLHCNFGSSSYNIKRYLKNLVVFLLCQLFLLCYYIVPSDMEGCIYHFNNRYIHIHKRGEDYIISAQRFLKFNRVYNILVFEKPADTIRYDTIRYDTIQYDTMRYDTIRYDTIRYDTIRYDTIRYDTIRYDTIRYDTIRYDTIRYDTIRYDTIRYDTIRYDTIRYDTIRYDTIRYDLWSYLPHVTVADTTVVK